MNHTTTNSTPDLTAVDTIRARARKHIEEGAVTEGYAGDVKAAIKVLNEALATEIVCVLRYRNHHFVAKGIHSQSVAQEFLEHSNEEQGHADQIATRIVQLGGTPNLNPEGLSQRSHAQYVEVKTLPEMIKENLIAERIAIDTYREMIAYFSAFDPTTRRLLEGILAVEEEHAEDLASLLQ